MVKLSLFVVAATTALVVMAQAPFAEAGRRRCSGNSKFGENVTSKKSETCKKAINSLKYVSPNLKACYRTSGLYFSTPETVCSPNCFNATVEAAKKVAEACPVPKTLEDSGPAEVYNKWSCEKSAKAVCTKNAEGQYCLQALSSTLVTAETIQMGITSILNGKDLRKELGCDGVCAKALYEALQGDGDRAPVLYFYGYANFDNLFKAYEKVCGFKKPSNETTYQGTETVHNDVKKPCNTTDVKVYGDKAPSTEKAVYDASPIAAAPAGEGYSS